MIKRLLRQFPVTAILGPRQVGKTFLAKQFTAKHYFDLENPQHLKELDEPQSALKHLKGLIVIDEVQRRPDLFSLLRYLVDSNPNQKYLILGSASPQLIRQGSETLAGRIAYHELSGLGLTDVGDAQWRKMWFRGGYPRAFMARSDQAAQDWLGQYITTFLERDIPQLGFSIPSTALRRFWTMLAHYHGQTLNYSELGRSMGVSDMTIRKHLDILAGAFMVRLVQPWYENISKRLVKSPKVYIRDSGLWNHLISVRSMKELMSHPKLGAAWEGFALEAILKTFDQNAPQVYFWGVHAGAELDLYWKDHGKNWGIEFKYQDAPGMTKSLHSALQDLNLEHCWIIYPGDRAYAVHPKVTVLPLTQFKAGQCLRLARGSRG
ncbi:MAG: ATP-binding protein [Candidatus Omnitrophica bacterium]|nr:ATP-binding protein [Candidatus Omnitrophota bacterium]